MGVNMEVKLINETSYLHLLKNMNKKVGGREQEYLAEKGPKVETPAKHPDVKDKE